MELGRRPAPCFEGYVAYRGDVRVNRSLRGSGRGQGMVLYVADALAGFSKLLKVSAYTLWLLMEPPRHQPIAVCLVYLPPASSRVEWQGSDGWRAVMDELEADILAFRSRGEVVVMGDFNAHTGTLSEDIALDRMQRDTRGFQVLDQLGVPTVPIPAVAPTFPPRRNKDKKPVCAVGRRLVDLSALSGCAILNGRAHMDGEGEFTFVPEGRAVSSTIDYILVSAPLFPQVDRMLSLDLSRELGAARRVSDHNAILCVLKLPKQATGTDGPYQQQAPPPIRWDPSKRGSYVEALRAAKGARDKIIEDLRGGTLSVDVASALWCAEVCGVAGEVFGSPATRGAHRFDGRQAKGWFPLVKSEWAAIREAVRRGDTHAARAARKVFNAAKRRAKRYLDKHWERRLLHDLRSNPKRFWSAFRGRKMACALDLMQVQRYWEGLFGASGQRSLPECAVDVPALLKAVVDASTAPEQPAAAMHLSQPVTLVEAQRALGRLHSGRAPGPDGMRGELLKGAYEEVVLPGRVGKPVRLREQVLLGELHTLFAAAFQSRQVPKVWCAAFLSAVYKQGDPRDMDNYRGIAVGSVMGKIYSMILESRLSTYCERNGLRAEGQAGFRPARSTADNLFVLKHLVDKHRVGRSGRLYVCFVDFKKAYDRVRRDLLMQCLAEAGVGGEMLAAIMEMYWSAPLQPKVGADLGASFDSTRGVKQGDPLSPLLFGLFIDRIEKWLAEKVPATGVPVGGILCRVLLYADDLALLANTAEALQAQLDALHAFCIEYDMEVNTRKTEVVVFGKSRLRERPNLQYAGVVLSVTEEFKYLGMVFHCTKGVRVAVQHLAEAGTRAMWGLLVKLREQSISNIQLQTHLFQTLVAPVLSYASEVWGPGVLSPAPKVVQVLDNDLHRVQVQFLRAVSGQVRASTNRLVLMREYGVYPLARQWVQQSVHFWNRCVSAPASSLLGRAVRDNCEMARGRRPTGWHAEFSRMLSGWGYTQRLLEAVNEGPESGPEFRLCALEVDEVLSCFDSWFTSRWVGLPNDPREADSECVTCCTYQQWFAGGMDVSAWQREVPEYVKHTGGISPAAVVSLQRFRLGAHDLRVVTDRGKCARAARVCQRCEGGQVEDEFHMVFECSAYRDIRSRFRPLFAEFRSPAAASRDMARFMSQHPAQVAAFVHECCLQRGGGQATGV